MNDIQLLGLVATVLGIITAVFNLVVFVREKDPGHLRAGIAAVLVLAVVLGIVAFPHIAPGLARRMAASLPASMKSSVGSWLSPVAASPPPAATPAATASSIASPAPAERPAPSLQGSAQVEIRRNLLGGIDAVVAVFRFADLSNRGGRILSYDLDLQSTPGSDVEACHAVLEAPVIVAPGATAKVEVPLNGPVRERWLARHKEKTRGRGEVRWQGLDADGRKIDLSATLVD